MNRNTRIAPPPPKRANRVPSFDSGIISEPLLHFGGRKEHVDPKIGLSLFGPYSLIGQTRPTLANMIVGIVGPPAMISDASLWLELSKGIVTNEGNQPFLYPHFPGFNKDLPFQCDLVCGEAWRETIKESDIEKALKPVAFNERLKETIRLYVHAIEVLSQRDPKPNVILCCIPQNIIDTCTVQITKSGELKRRKYTVSEKALRLQKGALQLSLFQPVSAEEPAEEDLQDHQNLRRGIKSEAMKFGIPTQLVWPSTLDIKGDGPAKVRKQDIATRAWNFMVALYHKAGGTPWRIANLEPGICFVGISFYKEIHGDVGALRTSMAQAFTSAGDGYVLRGKSFQWDEKSKGKTPHLDRQSSFSLIQDVIELYKQQHKGSLPNRIVVHKTSRYWKEELDGFKAACELIPQKDFVALGHRGIQFYRLGDYPALRGTYIKFSPTNLLLYTTGYIPFLRTYPGARVPNPLEIVEHWGDSPWDLVLTDILSLTKMNWNTADFACHSPITIAFSRRISQILAEMSPSQALRPEYRFYM